MSTRVLIGVVKLFEPDTGRGVIAPKNVDEGAKDLYFATPGSGRFSSGKASSSVSSRTSRVRSPVKSRCSVRRTEPFPFSEQR
jgi:hypothetical protein